MARHNVQIQHSPQSLTITITGHRVASADPTFLTECLNAMMECAETNECFTKGFSIKCLETVAKHDAKCGCVNKAFGFV